MCARLEPIEKPNGLKMRLVYWMMRRKFGRVVTPLQVVFARVPGLLGCTRKLQKFHENGIHLDEELTLMVGTVVSERNGCGYCVDFVQSEAIRKNLGMEKFNALSTYQTNTQFTEAERAALAYAEEITCNKNVSDATFEALHAHFSEREIVELTWVTAFQTYTNLINTSLEIESDGLCAIATGNSADERTVANSTHE